MGLPTTRSAIAAAEQELGRRFPTPLRERLLRNNGGEIRLRVTEHADESWELHPVWDDATAETKRRSSNHVVREQATAHAGELIPVEIDWS